MLDQDKYEQVQAGYYNNGEEALFDVCDDLYDYSVQCNQHLQQNSNQGLSADARATCEIIDSFQKRSFDEFGYFKAKMRPIHWVLLLVILPGCVALILFILYQLRVPIENEDLDENLVEHGVRFSDDEPAVFT